MEKFCFLNHTSLRPNNGKMPVKGLYRNQKFQIQFRSMIYVALKYTLSEIEF